MRTGAAARIMRDERGQATVEAAVALPVMLCLVLLLVQPGIILYDRIVMAGAAAEGCRLLTTTAEEDVSLCEEFVMRRLGAVPQQDLFHIHDPACSWSVELEGCEESEEVAVSITTEAKPVPLIGLGAGLLGLTNDAGNIVVRVDARCATQPSWVQLASGHDPEGWVGAWI